MPIAPPVCIIAGAFISNRKGAWIILSSLVIITLVILAFQLNYFYYSTRSSEDLCFKDASEFIKNQGDVAVVSDQSTYGYYYFRKIMHPFPERISGLDAISNGFKGKDVYLFYTVSVNTPEDKTDIRKLKKELDSRYEEVFRCPDYNPSSVVYRYD